jgi:hypothetical protein
MELLLTISFLRFSFVQEFSESEWIFRAMSFIMLVSFVTIPILIIAEDNPRSSYFEECALVFVVCMSLLCFIFIPKMMVRSHIGTKEAVRKSVQNVTWQTIECFTEDRSSTMGALIMEHPKRNEELREQLKSLSKANSQLEKEVAVLKGEEDRKRLDDPSVSSETAHRTEMTGEVVPMAKQEMEST